MRRNFSENIVKWFFSILKKALESNKLKEKIQFHIYKRLIRQAYIKWELEIDSKEDVEEFLEHSINSLEDIEKKVEYQQMNL